MREYLLLFRGQAFNGALALMKRILLSNILIVVLMSIVATSAIFPLLLNGFGWTIADVAGLKDKMQDVFKALSEGGNPWDVIGQLFGQINYAFLALAALLGVLFSVYQYVTLFKLNDNEVRTGNRNVLDAFKMGFSEKIIAMLGLYFILFLIFAVGIGVYIFALVLISGVSKFMAVLLGFFLFFVLIGFIIRFAIAPSALIHGNMGVFESIQFSMQKITWKRAGILFLMGLVMIVASMIIGGILGSVIAMAGLSNATTTPIFMLNQVIQSAIGAIVGSFMYAAYTALYFRYSDDERDEIANVEDHLIN